MTSRGICQSVGVSFRKGEHFPFSIFQGTGQLQAPRQKDLGRRAGQGSLDAVRSHVDGAGLPLLCQQV